MEYNLVMADVLGATTTFIQKFGSRGVFFAGIIEQIVVPIPSPIVPMGGGFFLIEKGISLVDALKQVILKVAVPFSLGSTLGATIVYLIAFKGAMFLIDRLEKYLEFGWKDIERVKKKYFKGKPTDEILIFLFMAIPVIPSSLISAVCGAIRISAFDFYLFTFLGLAVRGTILGLFGWWFGEAYLQVAQGVNKIENIAFLLMGLALGGLLVAGYKKRDKFFGREN